MLQLVYVSTARGDMLREVAPILQVSRANNRRDGVTGLLHYNGQRFLQVLEGPEDRVRAAFDRIRADARHFAAVILSQKQIGERAFGDWAMAHQAPGEQADAFARRVGRLVEGADASTRATFESFVALRRAA